MQTLSDGLAAAASRRRTPTNVMCLVEHHDRLFTHLLRYTFCNLGVEEVVERIDHDVDERELLSDCH